MEISRNNFSGNVNYSGIQNNQPKKNDKTSFKGFDNVVVATMDAIERGGMAASFTIQDMLGTNIPRTLTALDRNREELGHPNYAHAGEVAIREFVTGPLLFLVPAAILKTTTIKHKAGEVSLNTINALSDVLGEYLKNAKNLKDEKSIISTFYNDAFKNILENANYKGLDIDEKAKEFASRFEKALNSPKKGFFKKLLNKAQENTKDDMLDKLANDIIKIIKQNQEDSSRDFVEVTIGKTNKYNRNISKFFDELTNFTKDMASSVKKSGNSFDPEKFTKQFNKSRSIFRVLLNIFMTVGTIAVVSNIPKLYMRSKENPALAGLKTQEKSTSTNSQNPSLNEPLKKEVLN